MEELFKDREIRKYINESLANAMYDDVDTKTCDICHTEAKSTYEIDGHIVCNHCIDFIKFLRDDFDVLLNSKEAVWSNVQDRYEALDEGYVVPNIEKLYDTAKKSFGGDITKLVKSYGIKADNRLLDRLYKGELFIPNTVFSTAGKFNRFMDDFEIKFMRADSAKHLVDDADGYKASVEVTRSNSQFSKDNQSYILANPDMINQIKKPYMRNNDDKVAYNNVSSLLGNSTNSNVAKSSVTQTPSSGSTIGSGVNTSASANTKKTKASGNQNDFEIPLGKDGFVLRYTRNDTQSKLQKGVVEYQCSFNYKNKTISSMGVEIISIDDFDEITKNAFKCTKLYKLLPFLGDNGDYIVDIDTEGIITHLELLLDKVQKEGFVFKILNHTKSFDKDTVKIIDPAVVTSYSKFNAYISKYILMSIGKDFNSFVNAKNNTIYTSLGKVEWYLSDLTDNGIEVELVYVNKSAKVEVTKATDNVGIVDLCLRGFIIRNQDVFDVLFGNNAFNSMRSNKITSKANPNIVVDWVFNNMTIDAFIISGNLSLQGNFDNTFIPSFVVSSCKTLYKDLERYTDDALYQGGFIQKNNNAIINAWSKYRDASDTRLKVLYRQIENNLKDTFSALDDSLEYKVESLVVTNSGNIVSCIFSITDNDGVYQDLDTMVKDLSLKVPKYYEVTNATDNDGSYYVQYTVTDEDDVEKFSDDIEVATLESIFRLYATEINEGCGYKVIAEGKAVPIDAVDNEYTKEDSTEGSDTDTEEAEDSDEGTDVSGVSTPSGSIPSTDGRGVGSLDTNKKKIDAISFDDVVVEKVISESAFKVVMKNGKKVKVRMTPREEKIAKEKRKAYYEEQVKKAGDKVRSSKVGKQNKKLGHDLAKRAEDSKRTEFRRKERSHELMKSKKEQMKKLRSGTAKERRSVRKELSKSRLSDRTL